MRFSTPVTGLCAGHDRHRGFRALRPRRKAKRLSAYVDHASSALSIESLGLNELTDPVAGRNPGRSLPAPRQPRYGARFPDAAGRNVQDAPAATGRSLADLVGRAWRHRDAGRRERMPRPRRLFRIERRAAQRPARGRRSDHQPRALGPLPAEPCAASSASARNSPSFAAASFPQPPLASRGWRNAVAIAHIAQADLADDADAARDVLPCPADQSRLAADPSRHRRQPRLLPLGRVVGTAPALPFVLVSF